MATPPAVDRSARGILRFLKIVVVKMRAVADNVDTFCLEKQGILNKSRPLSNLRPSRFGREANVVLIIGFQFYRTDARWSATSGCSSNLPTSNRSGPRHDLAAPLKAGKAKRPILPNALQ
jgi:hypothetical protein